MKAKTLCLAMAALVGATSASAQRVSWSVTIGHDPTISVGSRLPRVVTRCPPPAMVRPPPPRWSAPCPPRSAWRYEAPIRRSGVYAYARGPQRVYHPFGYYQPAVLQEWCPIRRAWVTIGRVPAGW